MSDHRQHVAVALSGGGHRASLFGLGALLYLVDAGKGPEIASVSSISGGSLTNGYVGLAADLTAVDGEQFRRSVKPLAVATATGGTVWARPLTYLYLLTLAAVVGVAIYLCFPLDGPWPFVSWAVALVVLGWLARRRSWVARKSFDAVLFKRKRLADMHAAVDHVITACDLQTIEQVYFSGRFVYSYRHRWGTPGDLRVAWAAQASACLPGAFAPVSRSTAGHAFAEPRAEAPPRFLLVDGGVYDNMGSEWPLRAGRRLQDGTPPSPAPHVPDEVIVVNASAAMGVVERKTARVPLLGEFTSLLADKDVLYDQTTAVRRRLLDARYRAHRAGVRGEDAFNGTTVQIDRSPLELPRQFARPDGDPRDDAFSRRAKAVIALLGEDTGAQWDDEAEASRSVGTNLSKIGAERAARLLRHAYALTMANCHVLLDYPLRPLPDLAEFVALVKKR